jgi:hypothetical protein
VTSVRVWVVAAFVTGLLLGGSAVAALVAWPHAGLAGARDGLARVALPGFAGRVAVKVVSEDGSSVPVQLRGKTLWPAQKLAPGERLSVTVVVRRPRWAGWLVGRNERRTFTVVTPSAHVTGRWLEPGSGTPVTLHFDRAVSVVSLGPGDVRRLARPRRTVELGVVAGDSHRGGTFEVAAVSRSWERLPARVRVTWFVAQPDPQLLVEPRAGAKLAPGSPITLTFSRPIAEVLGSRKPRLSPATPGRWRPLDAHTLVFQPSGFGFGLGARVHVRLPRPVLLGGTTDAKPVRGVHWQVPPGSTLRLQQLLAGLGYLPVRWRALSDPPPSKAAELAAAVSPPHGLFSWRYPRTPAPLKALWKPGGLDLVTQAAIMTFEEAHGLPVDGLPGPRLWRTLLADTIAGKRHAGGYSYVFVHTSVPESLNLWHNGRVIVRSPGNTGIPAAPTALGTWPVFEHIPVGTMSGTNPDGSHYNDPGIQYISYFHGGDAIHAFNRSSYGTPQSLGCVELPLGAAAQVWPYTPIGTLVTVEN